MAKKLTHILFDFDGTIADSKKIIANSLNFALEQHELKPVDPKKVYPLIGKKNLEDTFLFFYPKLKDEELVVLLKDFRQYQIDHTLEELEIFPMVGETLKLLQQKGIVLAILTTKNHVQINQILEMLGLKSYFEVIYGNGLPYGEKPDGSCVTYILSQLPGSEIEAVAMVGDSEVDAATAKNGGIRFIGVSHGVDTSDYLYECGAEVVLKSFDELKDLTK